MKREVTGRRRKGNSAQAVAEAVADAYLEYQETFGRLTRRAAARFLARDWLGMQRDALNRLLLYEHRTGRAADAVRGGAGAALTHETGVEAKREFARRAQSRADVELAQTFYNSVIRRAYGIPGALPALEFVGDEVAAPAADADAVARVFDAGDGTGAALRALLASLPFAAHLQALEQDAALGANAIDAELAQDAGAVRALEAVPQVFYRGKGAYVVGRVVAERRALPLVLAFVHEDDGVQLDAVLPTADEASVVFGFTRSYFHAELPRPRAVIDYLRALMPLKRLDELYTALGFHRHGKTELHRQVMQQLAAGARLVAAPGDPGLVMSVFVLPELSVVFKLIKDRFAPPKRATRDAVMQKYEFIFKRDRVGRLADAQEFRHLELPREAFDPEVLDELARDAARTVEIGDARVLIHHVYTERRVTPFNLYLKETGGPAALDAMLDYGNAIKELAAANIFPGDMLFKNFGVTRHGRVLFYDYDEVEDLTDCSFRRIPESPGPLEEMAAESWFGVGEHDVFPEEFARYMLLQGPLGEAFRRAHGDLFTIEFWQAMQALQRTGVVVDFFPYRPARRLRADACAS